ncbi:MAG: hypothetical protein IM594_10380, partial [Cytophagales bacterium]|nr:hypothetical protein [Cytophagales bacterium]
PTAQQTYRKSYNPSQIYTRSLDQPTNQTQSAALNRTSQDSYPRVEVHPYHSAETSADNPFIREIEKDGIEILEVPAGQVY